MSYYPYYQNICTGGDKPKMNTTANKTFYCLTSRTAREAKCNSPYLWLCLSYKASIL
jgi:hypothetical protein